MTPAIWPSKKVMQMHMDCRVPTAKELERHRSRGEESGARVLLDQLADDGEPLYVLADPAGQPCRLLVQ